MLKLRPCIIPSMPPGNPQPEGNHAAQRYTASFQQLREFRPSRNEFMFEVLYSTLMVSRYFANIACWSAVNSWHNQIAPGGPLISNEFLIVFAPVTASRVKADWSPTGEHPGKQGFLLVSDRSHNIHRICQRQRISTGH